jgi:hypothetical protein
VTMDYASLSTKDLASELELHAESAPIDMTRVTNSLRSLGHALLGCDADCERGRPRPRYES